jgi:hypothetical protein
MGSIDPYESTFTLSNNAVEALPVLIEARSAFILSRVFFIGSSPCAIMSFTLISKPPTSGFWFTGS